MAIEIASSKSVERGDREHRSEDLLLEDAHVVRALEDRRLHVVALGEVAAEVGALAADQQLRAALLADVDVRQDLLELVVRRLGADHRLGVERVALLDRADPLDAVAEQLVVDRPLDERARRARADLALVQREEREALERLVVERVALARATSSKKTFGLLPPSSSVTGIRFCDAYCMIRRPVVVSPVNAILRMLLVRRERRARLDAEAVDDVQHSRRDAGRR